MRESDMWLERWLWSYPPLIMAWLYGNWYWYWIFITACVIFWIRTLIAEGKETP